MKTSTLYLGALVGAFVAVACDPSEPGGVSDTDPADLSEVDEPADGSDAANVEVDTDSDPDKDGLEETTDTSVTPTSPSPTDQALERLESASSVPVEAAFTHGAPRTITMRVPLPAGADPMSRARAFLVDHADLYGLRDPARDLAPQRWSEADGVTRTVFAQLHEGVPVFGARIAVHSRDDQVIMTSGAWMTRAPHVDGRLLTDAAVIDAAELALSEADRIVPTTRPKLFWFDPALREDAFWLPGATWDATRSLPVLSYSLEVLVRGVPHTAFIHAQSGALLASHTHHHTIDWDVETGNNDWTESCFIWSSSNDLWFTEDGPDGYPGESQDAYLDGFTVQDKIGTIYDWFRGRFGWKSYDNDDEDMVVIVHVGDPERETPDWRNAAWVRGCDEIHMGDSYATFDVLTHEHVHGVISHTSELVYERSSGAINESMSDVFAGFVTGVRRFGATAELFGGFRDLWFPAQGGQPEHVRDYVRTDADSGGVHINSGITNRAASLLHEPLSRVGVELPIPGLSAEAASCLLFVVMVHVLQPHANMIDLADAMLGAVRNEECNVPATAANQCTVINAYATVGLRHPDTDCDGRRDFDDGDDDDDDDGRPDNLDNCRTARNPSQADLDGDGQGDACDEDDDGDGVADGDDNCPSTPNPDQAGQDGRAGDACWDSDSDGVLNLHDLCPSHRDPFQRDGDGDGLGDACDVDLDNDNDFNNQDNCPLTHNPDQQDSDGDEVGDACDVCPAVADPDQTDCDGDGVGKACLVDPEARGRETVCEVNETAELLATPWTQGVPVSAPIPLPSCLGCATWLDPWAQISVTVEGALLGDRFVVVDDAGAVVSRSPALALANTALSFTYTPGLAIWSSTVEASPVRLRSFALRRVGLSTDISKIKVSVSAAE